MSKTKKEKNKPLKTFTVKKNIEVNVYKTKSKYSYFYITVNVNDLIYLKSINFLKNNGKPFLAYPSYQVDDEYKNYFYFDGELKETIEKELKKLVKKSKDDDDEVVEDDDDDDENPFLD